MQSINWKEDLVPHLISVAIFLIIAMVMFSPLLGGKVLSQGDTTQFKGMAKEALDYKEATGEEALWTNSMFGGMPTYQISAKNPMNVVKWFELTLRKIFPFPIGHFFMCMFGFYLLMQAMSINRWLSVIGALAFAFSTYNFLIIEAGHNTKFVSIAYMAPVVAGMIYAFRRRWLFGGFLFGLALAFNIHANHIQITYYLFLCCLIFFIMELVRAATNGTIGNFAKTTVVMGLAAVLAIGANASKLWTTYEYSKETIRGASELSSNDQSSGGLDKDYALAWSYGIMETMTLMIPGFYGGSSQENLGTGSQTYEDLIAKGASKRQAEKAVERVPYFYWGTMPMTGGPVYFGAIICFLFFLGAFIVRGQLKWWLIGATVLSILLSWGRNLEWFTDIFFYYMPFYNKFRTVSMSLVIAQFTMPVLGILGLNELFKAYQSKEDGEVARAKRALMISAGIAGGLCLFFAILGGSFFDFEGIKDDVFKQIGYSTNAIIDDRVSYMSGDGFRSFALIAIVAGLLFAYLSGKVAFLKKEYLMAIIGVLMLGDLWQVGTRYLTKDDYMSEKKNMSVFKATAADKEIYKDRDPNFRVLNMSADIFNDAVTSYKHKSIGGYHGAKLRRYNELIEQGIAPNLQAFQTAAQANPTQAGIEGALAATGVLNMLNTKYIIVNPEAPALRNPSALGNAWFVNEAKVVPNADAELAEVTKINPAETAVVDQRYSSFVSGKSFSKDPSGSIQLTNYTPNGITYESNASKEQLAVFSEIYYNSGLGWNAYIDGQLVDHFRANYVLRSMVVPAGKHTIDFKFEPSSYKTGNMISLICGLILLGGAIGTGVMGLGGRKEETVHLEEERREEEA